MTSATESADVVDTPDAAAIPAHSPGRGYLRRSGLTTQFQTARVSGPAPADRRERARPAGGGRRSAARGPGRMPTPNCAPWWRWPRAAAHGRAATAPSLAAAAAGPGAARHAGHRRHGRPRPARDRRDRPPDEQEQPALTLDLTAGGRIAIAGRGGSGRTTVLRTIALAAAAAAAGRRRSTSMPIDAAGTGLPALLALPQVGTVAQRRRRLRPDRRAGRPAARRGPTGRRRAPAGADRRVGAVLRRLRRLRRRPHHRTAARAGPGGAGRPQRHGRRSRAAASVLAAQVTAVASTRFVLALSDPGDYVIAGVAGRRAARRRAAGPRPSGSRRRRGAVRGRRRPGLRPAPMHTRPARRNGCGRCPARYTSPTAAPARGRVCIGVGGDRAEPIRVDLLGAGAWLLVAGPPRSGRTTLLQTVLVQSRLVRLPRRRAAAIAAAQRARGCRRRRAAPRTRPRSCPPAVWSWSTTRTNSPTPPAADQLERWLAGGVPGRAVVAAGRTEALALGYRGLVSRLRSAGVGRRCCTPAPGDPPVFGVPVPCGRSARPPGRGVLVPDPRLGPRRGADPAPGRGARVRCTPAGAPMSAPPSAAASAAAVGTRRGALSPCAGRCDRSAARTSP